MLQLLKFIPDWLWLVPILSSILVFAASYLPQARPFKHFIKPVALLLVILGIFMSGAQYANAVWQQAAKELELKVQVAEAKSEATNKTVEQKVVVKTQVVRERGETITKYVDREIVKYNNQCVIPAEFIKAHNSAAEPPK